MSVEASAALELELAREQSALPRVGSLREAFARPDVLLFTVIYFAWSMGVYGFVLWLPLIIRTGASIGIERTGLLASVPYLLAAILMSLVSYLSDRTMLRKVMVWPCLTIAGVALFSSFLIEQRSFWMAYFALIVAGGAMYGPYGSFFALISEMIPKTTLDEVLALVNSSGALGGFVGIGFVGVLQARTGGSGAGLLLMSGSLIAAALLTLLIPSNRKLPEEPIGSSRAETDGLRN